MLYLKAVAGANTSCRWCGHLSGTVFVFQPLVTKISRDVTTISPQPHEKALLRGSICGNVVSPERSQATNEATGRIFLIAIGRDARCAAFNFARQGCAIILGVAAQMSST